MSQSAVLMCPRTITKCLMHWQGKKPHLSHTFIFLQIRTFLVTGYVQSLVNVIKTFVVYKHNSSLLFNLRKENSTVVKAESSTQLFYIPNHRSSVKISSQIDYGLFSWALPSTQPSGHISFFHIQWSSWETAKLHKKPKKNGNKLKYWAFNIFFLNLLNGGGNIANITVM